MIDMINVLLLCCGIVLSPTNAMYGGLAISTDDSNNNYTKF